MDDRVLREKLSQEVDRVSWRPLVPHHERGHLWLLDSELDLVQVGMVIARDEVGVVSAWIQGGRIRRPADTEAEAWTRDPDGQHFEFLIVQPFVLAIEHRGSVSEVPVPE